MQLINDWKRQFPRLWSVRLALLAAVLSAAEVGINVYITGQPPMMALSAMLVSLGSAIARIVAQPSLEADQ